MAKIALTAQLKKDNGTVLATIPSGDRATKTEAEAVINAEIQARVTAAQGAAQDLVDAQTAFNS